MAGPDRLGDPAQARVPDAVTAEVVDRSIEQTGPMGAVAAFIWRSLTQRYIELEAESLDARVTGKSHA